MPLPPELTVEIRRTSVDDGTAHYLAVLKRANDAEIGSTTFAFRDDTLVDMEPQWLIERAVPRGATLATQRGDLTSAQEAQAQKLATYGQRLYGFLFGDGRDLEAFCKYNDAYRQQARLTLALHSNAAQLWRLPWEYLHDGDGFLALNGRFLLSRKPYGLGDLNPPTVPLPLRILVIVSAPDDQAPLDTEEEIGVIQDALADAVSAGRVTVDYLDDATLPAIGAALARVKPQVIHYTGHGVYKKETGRSVLALEREDGRARLAGIDDLKPYLAAVRDDLRLVVLSACQSALTGDTDAFGGVATGLLNEDVPAVLAMQFSILDNSAIQMARAFYAALAAGRTPSEAAQATRVVLRDYEEGPGYDWGVPALYLRAQGMRLVDPQAEIPAEAGVSARTWADAGGLLLPPHFVGRKPELRTLRKALRERNTTAVFVRGIGGMGKSSLVAKFIERPGTDVDGVCVIRCHEVDALDIPKKLADFLAAQGKAGHAEAAGLLLDSRLDPQERIRHAVGRIADRRYLFVFDNFESVQTVDGRQETGMGQEGEVQDEVLRGLLAGLVDARWRSLCVFTGRFRWPAIDDALGRGTAEEIRLPALGARQAIMLMDNLPRLRHAPIKTKIALYNKVGGHPKSLELLNGWLVHETVETLLNNPALDAMLHEQWEGYFLRALLAHLTPAELNALTRLSIFRTALDDAEFTYAGVENAAVRHWLDLSLIQQKQSETFALSPEMLALVDMLPPAERATLPKTTTSTYTVHPVVRDYLLGGLADDARRELHTWAAKYHGKPFVDVARQAIARQTGQEPNVQTIGQLARYRVVEANVSQTQNMSQARNAMARALEWHRHLFQAGDYDPAGEIVTAVYDILDRWGQRDRAKGLLRGSIATLEGGNRAVAQGNLATLLIDEGKLDEALVTYEDVYHAFEMANGKQQMAAVLSQISKVYLLQGDYDNAIEYEERSLALEKERGNEEGQAISLHQLAILYRHKGELTEALARSQAAEALDRKRGDQAGLAIDLHEQGLILTLMTPEQVAASLGVTEPPAALAVARFQESLEIERRIGNESGAADSLGELGKLLIDSGQYQQAIQATNEALEIARKLGDPVKTGIRLEALGLVHEMQGQFAAALEKFREALGLLERYGSPQQVAIERNHVARVEAKLRA